MPNFPTKEQLRDASRFHLVNPAELDGVQEYCEWLEALLHGPCEVAESDSGDNKLYETKQLVDRIGGLKIEIYPNEHPPPHFHVRAPSVNASFKIADCSKIKGQLKDGDFRKIKHWHKYAKPVLIDCWNNLRPTACQVGEYNGT